MVQKGKRKKATDKGKAQPAPAFAITLDTTAGRLRFYLDGDEVDLRSSSPGKPLEGKHERAFDKDSMPFELETEAKANAEAKMAGGARAGACLELRAVMMRWLYHGILLVGS